MLNSHFRQPSGGPYDEHVALIVEDDDSSADLLRLHLEAEGLKVLCAGSAEEALKLAPQQSFALIALDILLPGMDGWEFLGHIKRMPALANVPVVII